MTVAVTNEKTGKVVTCCLTCASDMIGIYTYDLYKLIDKAKLNHSTTFTIRHFVVNIDAEHIPNKKRGKPIQEIKGNG